MLKTTLLLLSVLLPGAGLGAQSVAERSWPRWRGPIETGFAPHADPPVTWSETENVRWKTALPGNGHSTPVVWGDLIFVTAAVPVGPQRTPARDKAPGAHDNLRRIRSQRSLLLCVGRKDGKILWEKELHVGLPHEGGHVTGSFASGSPATDGEHVIAFFGSRGLYATTMDGELVWKASPGEALTKHAHGEGSSPALHGDTVVVNQDHEGQSFVAAYEKRTGKERWRVAREEVTSWSSPVVTVVDGKPQVIVSGTARVRAYDLATGKVIWECGGLAHNVVASPVVGHGMAFVASSYEKQAMLGLKLAGARGDLTVSEEHLAWVRRRRTPYVPSPLLYGDRLYLLHHYQGVLSRVQARSGAEEGRPMRLLELRSIYASPVAAAGRIYVSDLEGATLVMTHDARPRRLALNRLDDRFAASAALVGRDLLLRGERHLYCITSPRAK